MSCALLNFVGKLLFFFFFSVPFTRLRQFLSLSLGYRRETVVSEPAGGWAPRAFLLCASLVPQPHRAATPLATDAVLSVRLQICTQEEFLRKSLHMHHLAIFCNDRTRDLNVFQHKRRTLEWWSVHTYWQRSW